MQKFLVLKTLLASILSIGLLATVAGCSLTDTSKDLVAKNYLQNAVIYEVNTRQFTQEGTFAAFQEHLPRLKDLGVDILWLMPIQPISELNRKGTLGSPYSVADYYGVNPEFGTADDFRALVSEAHKQGFKVILDWVANHTGWDNPWVTQHPDWYTKDSAGNITRPIGTDWTDVADLNYDNLEMRTAMIDAMKYWVSEFDIDGFRADVAHSVPQDFWEAARSALEEIKPVFMVAEDGGNLGLLQSAFDTNYAWGLKDLFNKLGSNKADASKFRLLLKSNGYEYKDGKYQMVFIDNHDENSWTGTVFERMGQNVKGMAVLSFTVPGLPLIYGGNEVGLDRRLEFFEKDSISWPSSEEWGTTSWELFYKKLVELRTNNPALWSAGAGGELVPLNFDRSKVVSFSRTTEADGQTPASTVIVLVNVSDKTESTNLELGDLAGAYREWFADPEGAVQLVDGQQIEMEPNSYKVFVKDQSE